MNSKSNLFLLTTKLLGLPILILGFSSCSSDKTKVVQDRLELEIFAESENSELSLKQSLDSKTEFSPLDPISFRNKNKASRMGPLKIGVLTSCQDPSKQTIEAQNEFIGVESFLLYEVLPKQIQFDHLGQEYICEMNMEFTNSVGSKFITRSGVLKVRGKASAFEAELRRNESPLKTGLPRVEEEHLVQYTFETLRIDTKKVLLSCEGFESQNLDAPRPRIQLLDIPRAQPKWINPSFANKRITQKCRILAKDEHQVQSFSPIFWLQRSYAGLGFNLSVRPPEKLVKPGRDQFALLAIEFSNPSPTPVFIRMPQDQWLKPLAVYERHPNMQNRPTALSYRYDNISGASGSFRIESATLFIELPPKSSHRLAIFQVYDSSCFALVQNADCPKIQFSWNSELSLELLDPHTDPNVVLRKLVLENSLQINGIH